MLAPLVKKIEGHVDVILQEGERFRQDNARLKNVADFQQELNVKLLDHHRVMDSLREDIALLVFVWFMQERRRLISQNSWAKSEGVDSIGNHGNTQGFGEEGREDWGTE